MSVGSQMAVISYARPPWSSERQRRNYNRIAINAAGMVLTTASFGWLLDYYRWAPKELAIIPVFLGGVLYIVMRILARRHAGSVLKTQMLIASIAALLLGIQV